MSEEDNRRNGREKEERERVEKQERKKRKSQDNSMKKAVSTHWYTRMVVVERVRPRENERIGKRVKEKEDESNK